MAGLRWPAAAWTVRFALAASCAAQTPEAACEILAWARSASGAADLAAHSPDGIGIIAPPAVPAGALSSRARWIRHQAGCVAAAYGLEEPDFGSRPVLLLLPGASSYAALRRTREGETHSLSHFDRERRLIVAPAEADERTIRHETLHWLFARSPAPPDRGGAPAALWFEEGLAEWWSGLTEPARFPGGIPEAHLDALSSPGLPRPRLRELMDLTAATERHLIERRKLRELEANRVLAACFVQFLESHRPAGGGDCETWTPATAPDGIYRQRWVDLVRSETVRPTRLDWPGFSGSMGLGEADLESFEAAFLRFVSGLRERARRREPR